MIGWLELPLVKWLLPVPLLLAIAPIVYWFFRGTWKKLDADAAALRRELDATGRVDYRPLVTLTLGVLILTMQEYFGQVRFFAQTISPFLASTLRGGHDPNVRAHLGLYAETYGRLWWGLTRLAGYLTPFLLWRAVFPQDSLRDMGLRFAGLRQHAWLYALFVVIMVPVLVLVSRQPDFGAYYPICATAGRSWAEFAAWEGVYVAQFIGLEMFFRGWWIRTTRVFGTGAIFSMVVPYCMVHFGKPYLEACAAIIAGVVLGSLAIQTRSIWAGVSVHVTVALLNDILALDRKHQLPTALTARSSRHLIFPYWRAIIWGVWILALIVLLIRGVRVWPQARASWRRRRADRPT